MKRPRTASAIWHVYIMRAKLMWLGTVQASSQRDAIVKAVERFGVRKSEEWRLSVRREE